MYQKNHYVPQWLQKRFIPDGVARNELHYLDLKPLEFKIDGRVQRKQRLARKMGTKSCFVQDDLYTTYFDVSRRSEIEEHFFGPIDQNGKTAVELFSTADHTELINNQAVLYDLLLYIGTQKFRTPKGLRWLTQRVREADHDSILAAMVQLRELYSTFWMESVWQIASANESKTKLIISDHPVTVYNRRCGPSSQWCRNDNDPEIQFNGTHTIFPLSPDKLLILTNPSWARNPYSSEVIPRPHPVPYRPAVMNFLQIQLDRKLTEIEVMQINFITKARASRYIAAGKEEWLYPERHVTKSDWRDFGDGNLLMPDPRPLQSTIGTIMGFGGGRTAAYDAYGRTPEQPEYEKESQTDFEFAALQRWKGEFARLYGPRRRGLSSASAQLDPESDSEKLHQMFLDQEKPNKWKMTGFAKK